MINFQRLRAGQPWKITQTTSDAILGSAEEWAKHRHDPDRVAPPEYRYDGTIVRVRNDGSADLTRFSAAEFSASTMPIAPTANLPHFQSDPLLSVAKPADATGNYCILLESIKQGATGLALVSGVAPVQIKLSSGAAAPTWAAVVSGHVYLQPALTGISVLWCDSYAHADGDGLVWAYVLLPAAQSLVGFELYDDIAPGQTDKYVWQLKSDYTRDTAAGHATVKVSDGVLGDVRAYGSNHSGWSSASGAKGFYIPGTAGKNQIVAIQRLAKMIKVGIGGTAVAGAATFVPTALAVMDGGQDPSHGGDTYPTIRNYSTAIPASASGIICAWDESAAEYLVIDAPCP